MTDQQLSRIQGAFESYIQEFASPTTGLHPFLQLKVDHSCRVSEEAGELSAELHWTPDEQRAATVLGLLHDAGRFPQFADYGTFSDAKSIDHGRRGWETVRANAWLKNLEPRERQAILTGIRYHNRRDVPPKLNGMPLAFLEIIRDADKLDIFRIVLAALQTDGFEDLTKMLPGIALDKTISAEALLDIHAQRTCCLRTISSLGDFLVMLCSWVFDLNTTPAVRRLRERGILPSLLAYLQDVPAAGTVREAVLKAESRCLERDRP